MNVPSGYTALDLIGFTDKGAYNSATSYVKNDLVSYNGEKWRCKLDDTVNHTPEEGTYWTIFIDAPSALDDLADVTISSVANGNILEYDSATSKWKNSTGLSDVKQALSNEVVTRSALGAHNLFNYDAWKSVPVVRGTAVFENNGITLTATENDCYTRFEDGYYPVDARIPVKEGQKIVLKWTTDEGSSKRGLVYIFPNGSSAGAPQAYSDAYKLEYTPTSGIEFITFRVAVGNSGNTIHYRNIMVTVATDTDPTYQPYAMTNKELTAENEVLANVRAKLGAHNLGKKYNGVTNIGLTLKDAPDGGNYVNGTATTSGGRLNLKSDNFVLKAGTYTIVGESNDHSKYSSVVLQKTSDNSVLGTYEISNAGVDKSRATVTLAADTECYFGFNTANGTAYGTDTFIIYPMVKLADDKDDTFYPYAKPNTELTKDIKGLTDNVNVMGAHNWLNLDASLLRGREGATYTFLPTGIEIANTTSGAFRVCSWWLKNLKPNTDYILSSDVIKVSGTGRMFVKDANSNTMLRDTYNISASKSVSLSFNTGTYRSLYIAVYSTTETAAIGDIKYENLLLRLASDSDLTYQPYAMTNKQLTDVAEQVEGGYILIASGQTVEVTADGTKTHATLLNELYTAIGAVFSNNPSYYIRALSCRFGTVDYPISLPMEFFNSIYIEYVAKGYYFGGGNGLRTISISSNSIHQIYDLGNATLTNISSDVPASGLKYIFKYDVYKQIS